MTEGFRKDAMFRFLPPPISGTLVTGLFFINTVFWASVLFFFVLIKLMIPIHRWRNACSRILTFIATHWIDGNSLIVQLTQKIHWDVRGFTDQLSPDKSYLMVVNHRSWADIFILQHVFNHRIPFLKFFLKKELIWVPILGLAWWALDFPFMKRYSRSFLEKHPELRGKDLETTRKACEKFKTSPVTVINFPEGTRFNSAKHQAQNSPYRNLLLPRAGGTAFVLSCMGEFLSNILDVTIVYPKKAMPPTFWDMLSGKVSDIIVQVNYLPLPDNVSGKNYVEDDDYKNQSQDWVNQLWSRKDQQMDAILTKFKGNRQQHTRIITLEAL